MPSPEQITASEDRLNVVSQAEPSEVNEVERLLNPNAGKTDNHDTDPLPEDLDPEDDNQRGQVDEELERAGTDDEREAIRLRRREEKQRRRQRGRDRVATIERQLLVSEQARDELARRVLEMERNNQSTQYAALRQQESEADQAIAALEDAHATAVTAHDGATATEAIKRLDAAKEFKRRVQAAKAEMERVAARPAQQPHLSKTAVDNARAFAAKHPWYKGPTSGEIDSKMLTALDNAMTAEGFDPATPAYWTELAIRGSTYLPHRFGKNPPERGGTGYNAAEGGAPRQSRSPVAGSSSAGAGSGGKSTYHLSSERVRAMKEAGIWDDPVRREGMIKRYRALDAETGN